MLALLHLCAEIGRCDVWGGLSCRPSCAQEEVLVGCGTVEGKGGNVGRAGETGKRDETKRQHEVTNASHSHQVFPSPFLQSLPSFLPSLLSKSVQVTPSCKPGMQDGSLPTPSALSPCMQVESTGGPAHPCPPYLTCMPLASAHKLGMRAQLQMPQAPKKKKKTGKPTKPMHKSKHLPKLSEYM